MKHLSATLSIILFFSMIFSIESFAQKINYNERIKKDVYIVYDFNSRGIPDTIWQVKTKKGTNTPTYKRVSKIWHSRRATLEVRINPYLYDVIINARQVDDDGLVDTSGAKFFLSALNTLAENRALLDETGKIIAQKEESIQPKTSDEVIDTLISKANKSKTLIPLNEVKSLNNNLAYYNDASEISDAFAKGELNLVVKDRSAQSLIDAELSRMQEDQKKAEDFKKLESAFHESLLVFDADLNKLQSEYDICEHAFAYCLRDDISAENIIRDIDAYIQVEKNINLDSFILYLPSDLYSLKMDINKAYSEVQMAYAKLRSGQFRSQYYNDFSISFDSTQKKNADTLYAQFNRIKPDVFAKAFILTIKNFQSGASFRHVSPTRLVSKDTLEYKITTSISSRYKYLIDRYNVSPKNIGEVKYPIAVKGNFKVNFSVGAAFMQDGLRAKEYYFSVPLESLEDDDAAVTIKEKESVDDFMPAIAAYTHGYLKLGGWFTPAITIGLSTNPTDFSNASYFLGGSLICGQQSRLIFTFGLAGSNVDVLKARYDVGGDYTKSDFINIQESELTEKAFQSGWFFGVSYNISSNR